VQARERNAVHSELAQVRVELTRELQEGGRREEGRRGRIVRFRDLRQRRRRRRRRRKRDAHAARS